MPLAAQRSLAGVSFDADLTFSGAKGARTTKPGCTAARPVNVDAGG